MTLKIAVEIEEQVKLDRASGMIVREIVEKYAEHGVTKKWVERVCRGIKKPVSPQAKAASLVYPLATSKQGVKQKECHDIYIQCFGVVYDDDRKAYVPNITKENRDYIKRTVKEKAEAQGKTAMFLPDWMQRTDAVVCNQLMLEQAQSLHDSMLEHVSVFRQMFPDANQYSVINEMLSLAFRGYSPESVESRCNRNATNAQMLDDNVDIPSLPKATVDSYRAKWEEDAKEYANNYIQRHSVSGESRAKRRETIAALARPAVPMLETKESLESFERLITEAGY